MNVAALFEIQGQIAFYEDFLRIRDIRIERHEILDIYIQEAVAADTGIRSTVISYWKEAEQIQLILGDDEFNGLSEKIEELLATGWGRILRNRRCPKTIAWFISCCAVNCAALGKNPELYGGAYKTQSAMRAQRKELRQSWKFPWEPNLQEILSQLYEGRSNRNYQRNLRNIRSLSLGDQQLVEHIRQTCGESGIWAWDLQRLIMLASQGFICEYLSFEESLDWCLKAGKKLQRLFNSWDDYMESYLLGYCYWLGDDLGDEESDASRQKRIYAYYKNAPRLFEVSWDYPLCVMW